MRAAWKGVCKRKMYIVYKNKPEPAKFREPKAATAIIKLVGVLGGSIEEGILQHICIDNH